MLPVRLWRSTGPVDRRAQGCARWPATWAGRSGGRSTASAPLSGGGGRPDGRPWVRRSRPSGRPAREQSALWIGTVDRPVDHHAPTVKKAVNRASRPPAARADKSAQRLVYLEAFIYPISWVFWLRFLERKISYFLSVFSKSFWVKILIIYLF